MPLPLTAQPAVTVPRGSALRCFWIGRINGLSFNVSGGILATDGRLAQFGSPFLVADQGNVESGIVPVPEGDLVWLSVNAVTAGMRRGDLYARIGLVSGPEQTAPELGQLTAGYITRFGGPGYPANRDDGPAKHDTAYDLREIVDPAVGTDFSFNPVGQGYTRINVVRFRLVTSAVAATRRVLLHIFGAAIAQPQIICRAVTTQTASLTRDYFFADWGFAGFTGSTEIFEPLPAVGMESGGSIATAVTALDAGDQISQIQVGGFSYIDA